MQPTLCHFAHWSSDPASMKHPSTRSHNSSSTNSGRSLTSRQQQSDSCSCSRRKVSWVSFMESVTEESIMSIKDKIYDLISCINIEAVTVPIDCHVIRTHSVKHVVLEFLKRVGHLCFCHVDIIGTGSDALGVLLCHYHNWSSNR